MKKLQRNPPIKDFSKHITGHTCSKCSTIYCEYSEELAQEIVDSLDSLIGSIVDVGKSLVRSVEQKYTEDDMIDYANAVLKAKDVLLNPKQWEKQK